jgi:succinylglutamate desuccinylase
MLTKKELLIIGATHGNEKIGVEVLEILKNKKLDKYFDFLIANPQALKQNKRFIDFDLNRAYPGDSHSNLYEKKRASQILKIASKYKYIIDIHEASQGINNFIIAPRKKVGCKDFIKLIDINTLLLWPDPKGPLGELLDNSIELEFGMKNKKRDSVVSLAEKIVEKIIKRLYFDGDKTAFTKQKYYYVYGKLLKKDIKNDISFKDFEPVRLNREKFFPLLVGQYINDGIVCYKMKKI